ncbi:hypothetical protein SEA_EFRA2_49 [Mycobacterium phage Efra2]|nr:hypothetical protein SEA_EFRA2_49 [Mycobacterium phage Efra2]
MEVGRQTGSYFFCPASVAHDPLTTPGEVTAAPHLPHNDAAPHEAGLADTTKG